MVTVLPGLVTLGQFEKKRWPFVVTASSSAMVRGLAVSGLG